MKNIRRDLTGSSAWSDQVSPPVPTWSFVSLRAVQPGHLVDTKQIKILSFIDWTGLEWTGVLRLFSVLNNPGSCLGVAWCGGVWCDEGNQEGEVRAEVIRDI